MKFNINKFAIFWKIWAFFGKLEKISTWSWKIGKILEFFFKFPLLGRPFFSKKKCLWFCSKFAQMKFRPNKFAKFWNIRDFFEKVEKNPVSSLKFGKISNLKSDFFLTFQKKSRMFQNCAKLFIRKCIWANFEQDQTSLVPKIFTRDSLIKKISKGISI